MMRIITRDKWNGGDGGGGSTYLHDESCEFQRASKQMVNGGETSKKQKKRKEKMKTPLQGTIVIQA